MYSSFICGIFTVFPLKQQCQAKRKVTEQHKFRYFILRLLRSCAPCFSFTVWAQRVSQQQTVYLLGREASVNNRISIQLLLFEELKTWIQKVSPQIHLCDGELRLGGTVGLAKGLRAVRWCPRDGDPHSMYITPILDHVSSCLLQEKRFTKGMSSLISH